MSPVVDVCTGRACLDAKKYYDINNESQMKIFILVYKVGISNIAPPIPSLSNVIYLSKICGFRDNLLGGS